jgi:hypothetical protein
MSTKKETLASIQWEVVNMVDAAEKATFDRRSHFTLDIEDGASVVNFEDIGEDFSPIGYDERDRVIGIGIDRDDRTLVVVTTDCEGNINHLSPNDAPMKLADWRKIRTILKKHLQGEGVL